MDASAQALAAAPAALLLDPRPRFYWRGMQKIYPDAYGIDTWDLTSYGEVSVHIVNSLQYAELTGRLHLPVRVA